MKYFHLTRRDVYATRQRNGPLTAARIVSIRKFIQYRQSDAQNISLSIAREQSELTICSNAISNLEAAIPQGKFALRNHEENLTGLMEIQSRLKTIEASKALKLNKESHSEGLYAEMRARFTKPVLRISTLIDEQIHTLKTEVRNIWDQVRELELELEGWKHSQDLALSSLNHLESSLSHLKDDLRKAKMLLSPIHNIPSDVWRFIFRFVVTTEAHEFLSTIPLEPMASTAQRISHVCHKWHQIIHQEHDLWNNIAVYPSEHWPQSKYDLFKALISKSNTPITLVANLDQRLYWSHNSFPRDGIYYNNGLWRNFQTRAPEVASLEGKTYSLHFTFSNGESINVQEARCIPFKQADSLIISSRTSIQTRSFEQLFSIFNSARSLTITNDCPTYLPSAAISTTMPNLVVLKFHLTKFPVGYQVPSTLVSRLEELHLHSKHEVETSLFAANTSLPKLRVLGITCTKTSAIGNRRMNALKKLVIYAPIKEEFEDLRSPFTGRLLQLRDVEFIGWSKSLGNRGNWIPSSLLLDIMPKSSSLKVVQFTDSFVDGNVLVDLFQRAGQDADAKSSKPLEEIILDNTDGITREHCELLSPLVKKIKVYA